MHKTHALLTAAVFLLAACEGLFTGSRESSHPLTQLEDGGYAPVKLQLAPEMSPIAFNLHASTVANALESQLWNSYRATLTLHGAPIATASFDVNNTGSGGGTHMGMFAQTMLIATVPQAGDYELTIALAKPKEITIESPRLEVRRNVQPLPK